jgi:antitoxin VapB
MDAGRRTDYMYFPYLLGGFMAEAKLFMTGGSQAVRLPKEFRFPGQSVSIRRDGRRVILEPIDAPVGRPVEEVRAWLASIQAIAGEGFERPDQGAAKTRDWDAFD